MLKTLKLEQNENFYFNLRKIKNYNLLVQSWIFKSFSGIDADADIDATHKIAIFK